MRKFLMSAAAIALAASCAYADPGNGKGNGGNKGGGPPEVPAQGKGKGDQAGHGPSVKGPAMKGPSSNGPANKGPSMKAAAKADRGPATKPDRGPAMKAAKGPPAKAASGSVGNTQNRAGGDYRRAEKRDYARDGYREVRTTAFLDRDRYNYVEGCPPGLAKKHNGCVPPGLAKSQGAYYQPSYFGYRSPGDGRYYYDNGYLYRTGSNGSILGYIPLLGGALSVGNQWPSYYQPVSVPDYYVDYYNLGPDNSYRYADNVLYRVDPQSSAITSIAALLTGDRFAVGQPMPSGYDVYNVPYAYRDRYYDTPESNYRYSDGYVYQVDPTTQLIQAAIQLLT